MQKSDPDLDQVWKHCRPPGSGPVTYNICGSSLGWLFTCPYCLTLIDSHHYTTDAVFAEACRDHLVQCRVHNANDAVRAALVTMTEKRDRLGRPVYAVPGGNKK